MTNWKKWGERFFSATNLHGICFYDFNLYRGEKCTLNLCHFLPRTDITIWLQWLVLFGSQLVTFMTQVQVWTIEESSCHSKMSPASAGAERQKGLSKIPQQILASHCLLGPHNSIQQCYPGKQTLTKWHLGTLFGTIDIPTFYAKY